MTNYDWIPENEFKQEYIVFIESRKERDKNSLINLHKHHIKPRHYYVDINEEIDNSEDNLISLTPSEHAYAHYILCKATNNYKDHCSVWRTLRGLKPENLKDLEFLDYYEYPSMPQDIKNKLIGRKRTKEQKERIAKASIGNVNALGYKHTPEAIEKMRNLKINKKPWNKGISGRPKSYKRTFFNTETKVLEKDISVSAMAKKHKLGVSSMNMLANKHKESFRNWICLDNLQPSQRQEILNSLEGSETRD